MLKRIFLLGALSCFSLMGGCKKAEQPSANSQQPDNAVPAAAEKAAAPRQAPSSGPAVLLKVKWPVGNRYVYRMDLDQHSTNRIPQMPTPMKQDTTMAMTYSLNVLEETPEGGRILEMEFLANEMEVKMGQQVLVSFDSKEGEKDDSKNLVTGPLRKMIGSKVRLQLNANGKVDKVLNFEEWQRSLIGDKPGPAAPLIAQQFNEGYFQQIADFGRGFPDKPVRPGESWPYKFELPAGSMGKIALDCITKFKALESRQERQCAALDLNGSFQGAGALDAGPAGKMTIENGKVSGITWFDPDLGALVESGIDQTMRLKGQMPMAAPQNGAAPTFSVELGQKITMSLVELTKK